MAEEKQPIDLDALVATLLKERQDNVTPSAPAEPASEDTNDKVLAGFTEETDEADPVVLAPLLILNNNGDESGNTTSIPLVTLDTSKEDSLAEDNMGNTQAVPLVMLSEPDDDEAKEPEELPKPKKEKKRRLFARRRDAEEDTEEPEEWADWGLKPIGHYEKTVIEEETPFAEEVTPSEEVVFEEVPVIAPVTAVATEEKPAVEEMPTEEAVSVEDNTVSENEPEPEYQPEPIAEDFSVTEQPTIVIPAIPSKEKVTVEKVASAVAEAVALEEENAENDADQISMEEMVRVEDMETDTPIPKTQEELEEQFRQTREERARDFVFTGEDEELNDPEEEIEQETDDEEVIEDFTDYEEAPAVKMELKYRRRTAGIGLALAALLELVLLLLTVITVFIGQSPITEIGYLGIHLFAMILMAVVNYQTVVRGFSGLFSLSPNSDSAPAVATVTALVGVAVHFIKLSEELPLFTPLAGLVLVLCSLTRYLHARRVEENFVFVSRNEPKYTATTMDDEPISRDLNRRISPDGEARVGYFRRASFLTGYLSGTEEDDAGDDAARWGMPLFFVLSLVVSLALTFGGFAVGFWQWKELFSCLLFLTAMPFSLSVQIALRQCSRRMLSHGGFMVGWEAVKECSDWDAIVVDVADLYPDTQVMLHGIKTYSDTHIDDALLDAASLSIRSGGPLSLIFRRVIDNKVELLRPVDSLVYEQGMGLTGWVDGRRVLVGNRRLLQNHGVEPPSGDFEARYAKNGRQLVYLSTAGELSAMFVVSYLPDPVVKEALEQINRSKLTLLVRSCDSLVTNDTLCRDFQLDEYYVDVLPATLCRQYDELVEEEKETAPALLASNGHIQGTAMALGVCRGLKVKAKLGIILHFILMLLCFTFGIVAGIRGLSVYSLHMFAVGIASGVLSAVLPLLKRP